MGKPGITELLIASALEPELCSRLIESPDEAFQDFDLSEEEKELLRRPDRRLLRLLGAALESQGGTAEASPDPSPAPHAVVAGRALPEVTLGLTVVPCLRPGEGEAAGLSYAVWVNPLPAGADPATVPPPAGATLPGQPLAPLYAVIQISALELRDAEGRLHVGLSASLRQSSNLTVPAPAEGAGCNEEAVEAAAGAVRVAPAGERYDRLLDLLHVLGRSDSQ